jgi:hypothetical protein
MSTEWEQAEAEYDQIREDLRARRIYREDRFDRIFNRLIAPSFIAASAVFIYWAGMVTA